MDYNKLKKAVIKIEMPDDMKARVIENCTLNTTYETEETTMNKNTAKREYKKPILVAVAAALFICFALGAAAAGRYGFFSDIVRWDGAVTGAQYENATKEIDAEVISAGNGVVTVSAVLLRPDAVPYSEEERLGIGSYEIIDSDGNVVAKGEPAKYSEIIDSEGNIIKKNGAAEFAEISDGRAEIKISAEGIESGNYKLIISSFIGVKKADKPLNICGEWECEFSV